MFYAVEHDDFVVFCCRTPHGVRGLKSAQCHKASPYIGTRHYPFWILDFLQSLQSKSCGQLFAVNEVFQSSCPQVFGIYIF